MNSSLQKWSENRFLNSTDFWNNTTKDKTVVGIVTLFTIFSIIITLLLNALILIVHFKRPALRKSFSVYTSNLATTEIILALTAMPGNLIRSIYGYWPYNAASCTFLLYSSTVFASAVRYSHVLITINRLWAVTFPLCYKTGHTMRVAQVLVASTWIFVHALIVPGIARDRVGKNVLMDRQCVVDTVNQPFRDVLTVQLLGFAVPELIVVFTYPYIAWRLWWRGRVKTLNNKVAIAHPPGDVSLRKLESPALVPLQNKITSANLSSPIVLPSVGEVPRNTGRNSWQSKPYNRILGYLVVAVIVCWTPNHVYYLLVSLSNYRNDLFFVVQYLALYANSWLNPFLIILADGRVRAAITNLLGFS